jgi:hypothetical protein
MQSLARPTRFELVTSAFGGQFPRFVAGCGGLRVVDYWLDFKVLLDDYLCCRLIEFAPSW